MELTKWTKRAVCVLAVGLGLVGCGSGGATSDTATGESANLTLAKIDTTNQQKVTAALFDSVDITTPKLPSIGDTSSVGSTKLASAPQEQLSKMLPNYKSLNIATGDPYTCSEGGSISSNVSGEVSTIAYDNCKEAGVTINGNVKLSYNEATKEITYMMSDYSMVSQNSEYTTSSTTFTIAAGVIKYTATGTSTVDGTTVEFNNYSYTLSLVDNKVNISIDGSVKADCLGNWVTVKTNQVMQLSDNSCPTAGDIEVQGDNSKLRVQFKNDKSIDIYVNDTLSQEYLNCDELPESSGICGEILL